jgi:hypothetical protein
MFESLEFVILGLRRVSGESLTMQILPDGRMTAVLPGRRLFFQDHSLSCKRLNRYFCRPYGGDHQQYKRVI